MAGADAEAVATVVRAQIAALREDDFRRAFGYASREIAEQFSLPQFEAMVRDGYAALGASAADEITQVRVSGAEAVVQVILAAPDGSRTSARYELAREDAGWRVTGVLMGPVLGDLVSPNGRGPH